MTAILRPDAPFVSFFKTRKLLESKSKTESYYGRLAQSLIRVLRVQSFYIRVKALKKKTANQLDSLILTGPILL